MKDQFANYVVQKVSLFFSSRKLIRFELNQQVTITGIERAVRGYFSYRNISS
jgi:hypothetical protein